MRFFTVLAACFAALATAAPHGRIHNHELAHSPSNPLLAGRAEIIFGACGGDSGNTCGDGFCCSVWGYCGKSDGYCGTGCQSQFGSCNDNSGSATAAAATNTLPSTRLTLSSYSAPAPTSYATTTAESSPAATTETSAPAATSSSSSSGSSGSGNVYKMYTGDGSTSAGWPSTSSWISFDSMWSSNLHVITSSCAQFSQTDNSDTETSDIKSAISAVASESSLDPRFILAIMMQESKGCVRVPTTNYGVTNPGLMQSHAGSGSCNNGGAQDPCPQTEIEQMLKDGAQGTTAGDGLSQCMTQSGKAGEAEGYYMAARIYNSGSVDSSGDLGAGIATHCYASDVANRLTGWVDSTTACTLDG